MPEFSSEKKIYHCVCEGGDEDEGEMLIWNSSKQTKFRDIKFIPSFGESRSTRLPSVYPVWWFQVQRHVQEKDYKKRGHAVLMPSSSQSVNNAIIYYYVFADAANASC